MNAKIREKWINELRGNLQARKEFYAFFEKFHVLKTENGVTIYKNILKIANEVGVQLVEVRSRLIPLLDQERPDVHLIAIGHKYLNSIEANALNQIVAKTHGRGADLERLIQEEGTIRENFKIPMKSLKGENRNAFLESFSGSLKDRKIVYGYLATKEMQEILSGPDCIAAYEEITEIAEEAGVSHTEIRDNVSPLLNKNLFEAYESKLNEEQRKSDELEQELKQKADLIKQNEEKKPERNKLTSVYWAEVQRLRGKS